MKPLESILVEHLERKHSHLNGWGINAFAAFYRSAFVVYTHHTCVDLATSIIHYPFVRLDGSIGYGQPHEFLDHKKAERLYRSMKEVEHDPS